MRCSGEGGLMDPVSCQEMDHRAFQIMLDSPGSHDFIGTTNAEGEILHQNIFAERGDVRITTKAVQRVPGSPSYSPAESAAATVGYQLALDEDFNVLLLTTDRAQAGDIHAEAVRLTRQFGPERAKAEIEDFAYTRGVATEWLG